MSPVIEFDNCSRWYGHVLGLSGVTWRSQGGVVGLLGPNGAGKSTLLKLIVGLMAPSAGEVRVFGESPYRSAAARARIGYAPEHESTYEQLTAMEFVTAMAKLSGLGQQAEARSRDTLVRLGLEDAMNRSLRTYSKGMKQRAKLAQCLVHDPDLVVLDEPLTGIDPMARQTISSLIRELGDAGKTVILSSHVLHEVEAVTEDILLIHRGQVLAEGNVYRIRDLIDAHPHRIRIECDIPRQLGASLATADHVVNVHFERGAVVVHTNSPEACYDAIATHVSELQCDVCSMTSPDNNMSAVFEYLTGGPR